MERTILSKLTDWKHKKRRKPLLVNGARQVGKTWILKEFGRLEFDNTAYIRFDNNQRMQSLFHQGFDLSRLVQGLQLEANQFIEPGKTLVIFDEVQENPLALTSLKYFCEDMPELAIAAAGSLLGLVSHSGTGFPVGKVDLLELYPLSFREFLDALDRRQLRERIDAGDIGALEIFHDELVFLLRCYYCTGGMPEVVAAYADNADWQEVREIQNNILKGYENDLSKHLGSHTEHALAAWRSIPAHLSQENRRFVFSHIREGARARDYWDGITWLRQAGVVQNVPLISKPGIPLSAYAEETIFKLFLLDVGLLGALSHLDSRVILEDNRIFTEFKGALSEQYVCQQLISECNTMPFYWKPQNSRAEVDFVVESESSIYSIEVKAKENLRSKSLRTFHEKYPDTRAVRFSLSLYRQQGWMTNVPLFAISNQNLWYAKQ